MLLGIEDKESRGASWHYFANSMCMCLLVFDGVCVWVCVCVGVCVCVCVCVCVSVVWFIVVWFIECVIYSV